MSGDQAIACWLAGGGVALIIGVVFARADRLPPLRTSLGLLVLGSAVLIGARAHALVLEEGWAAGALLSTPRLWMGWGTRLPGGVVLATALGPLVALVLRLSYWRFSDAAIAAGAALLAVGRIACHVAGCCFGLPTALPWAVSYGPGSSAFAAHVRRGIIDPHAASALPTHPFAIYLSLVAVAVLLVLAGQTRQGVRPGTRTFTGLALLGLGFGAIESVRDTVGNPPALYRSEMWLALGLGAIIVFAAHRTLPQAPALARMDQQLQSGARPAAGK